MPAACCTVLVLLSGGKLSEVLPSIVNEILSDYVTATTNKTFIIAYINTVFFFFYLFFMFSSFCACSLLFYALISFFVLKLSTGNTVRHCCLTAHCYGPPHAALLTAKRT